ncbi:MAG: TIGR03619 family F420-dependent LLM class oxidoreductase [Chloroflexota bacterium]
MPVKEPLQLGLMIRFGGMALPAGRVVHWSENRQMVKLAEDVGFNTLWVDDHLIYRKSHRIILEEGESRGVWEAFTLLSAIAEATTRVTMGPFVACTSFRNPTLLAKMADTIDDISGGRFILGLGAGWNEPEYLAYGYPFDHLASRFDEALQIITALLQTGHVDFQGTYYQARDCELLPRGPRPTGLPIWIGAKGPRMLGLVAKYAQAYNSVWHVETDQLDEPFGNARAACVAAGRDPATMRWTSGSYIRLEGYDLPVPPGTPRRLTGSYDDIAQRLHEFHLAGASHMTVSLEPYTTDGLERFARVIEKLRALEAKG